MVLGPKRKKRRSSLVGETLSIRWAFLNKYYEVIMLSDKVAYSWTCYDSSPHDHLIECLWIWHDCSMELDPMRSDSQQTDEYIGWAPTGVAKHDLISVDPLHIEASVYWPACCGMHGWIRNGQWIDA